MLLMPFYAQLTIPFFMTLTGFVYAASYEREGNWWNLRNIKKKCLRLIPPFVPALIIELLIEGPPEKPVKWLLSGGYAYPGSYYVILMLELLAIFPFIEMLGERSVKRNTRNAWMIGLSEVFIGQCAYELFTYLLELSGGIYRLLVFRYVIFIYGGVVIYKYYSRERSNNTELKKEIPWKEMIKTMPVGFIFIIVVGYLGYQPQVLFRYDTWFRSSAPTAFWVIPIIAFLIAHKDSVCSCMEGTRMGKKAADILAICGRASYHIYIVQMLWFGIVVPKMDTESWRKLPIFAVSVMVCGVCGVLYYIYGMRVKA